MILVLEKIDLKQSLKKDAYNEKMSYFETRLGELQRACRAAGIPVIILFEGWRGSQRSVIINHMMQQMDARGFRVYSASKMADEEPDQPFFEPFWRQLPAKGNMAVYYRSWYYLKNEYTFDRDADQVKRINTSYRHINAFEKQLTDDNYVLLKFFVHVSEKQLKANVQKAEKTYGKGWNKVSESDDDFVDYQRYLEIYEKMFIDSDRPNAHWYLIAGDDTRFAEVSIFDVIVQRLELALAEAEARRQKAGQQLVLPRTEIYDVLSKVDLSKEIAKAEYKEKLDKYQSKLSILQYEMYPSTSCSSTKKFISYASGANSPRSNCFPIAQTVLSAKSVSLLIMYSLRLLSFKMVLPYSAAIRTTLSDTRFFRSSSDNREKDFFSSFNCRDTSSKTPCRTVPKSCTAKRYSSLCESFKPYSRKYAKRQEAYVSNAEILPFSCVPYNKSAAFSLNVLI